jgi:hypothetical protein
MANFDISDLISTGMSRGVQMAQEDRAAKERQEAAAALANYRGEMLAQQAAQLAEQKRAAMERERGASMDRTYRSERDNVIDERYEDNTIMVNGVRMTPDASRESRERNAPKVRVTGPDGGKVGIDPDTWFRGESAKETASIQQGANSQKFDFDRLDLGSMTDNEFSWYNSALKEHGQYEDIDPLTKESKGVRAYSWAGPQFTRFSVEAARRAAIRQGSGKKDSRDTGGDRY